ncbi:bifunctional diaminohydroxyphosphoribosylaminopyrimidine deaminase/5-amino-6-(5-phosphoribosylamino)uracil reductase RibD [Rhabdobacter roseus]|uniref:Riboflavin biosynthesis protein RibD n=1 Tax=Rhabdobacter roseus TaxID=1655419 RepID=A0A840TN63_9BACT|nr:bifunctional diaminohydroxyphosphoribosylaminopyrimidine deaminase/5-amino-6-(5-phosphoribosylamino)uracil reductase RibD [Rhabdobacter roseus]MBB5284375.1 diaminohydroxyphosphoribosylaminopyrimidine deaminase/5-amino-6-(5-phosphoribosylamino)uracil reductase [Rhabdobacter roseus]
MNSDLKYLKRALQLAAYGLGQVSPNPMVGCVLVHDETIIGEGWHQQYGGPHAEVQAVRDAIGRGNEHLLAGATAYVTLEPCSHYGKTPPCADLLVEKRLQRVVIGQGDPNPLVAGRGVARLRAAGIAVEEGLLEEEGAELNRRFFTFFGQKRPYVILKWAETADGYLAGEDGKPLPISGELSGVAVHRWRSEEDAILVGTTTARVDNPQLNVRRWAGRNPVRVVLDRRGSLPPSLHLFDGRQPTLVLGYQRSSALDKVPARYLDSTPHPIAYGRLEPGTHEHEIDQVLHQMYLRNIQSVLVEGGATILNAFLERGLWDEIRRCQSTQKRGGSIRAPLPQGTLRAHEQVQEDLWTYYRKSGA